MMTDLRLYRLLLDGQYSDVLQSLRKRPDERGVQDRPELEALALALSAQVEAADKLIAEHPDRGTDLEEKATWAEAELVLAIRKKEAAQRIAQLAGRAVELSNNAVFAHRVLGDLAERARRAEDALQHYQAAFQGSPQNGRSRRDLARVLAHLKRRAEALVLVAGMTPSLRREIYRLSIFLRGLWGFVVALGLALALLHPVSASVALWLLLGVGLAVSVLGVRWRDGLVFAAGTRVGLLAVGMYLLGKFLIGVTAG